MNNIERSKFLFLAAGESLAEADFSFQRKSWNLSIRRAQEAVELSLTAMLALIGVHYPKDHDQAPLSLRVLKSNGFGVDEVNGNKIQKISIDLSRKRGPALHQDEGYDKETAEQAISDAKFVLETIRQIERKILDKIKK